MADHAELSDDICSAISRFCHWISCFTEQREVLFARVSDDLGNCIWERNMPVRDCHGHGVEISSLQLYCKMKEKQEPVLGAQAKRQRMVSVQMT